MLHHPPLSPLNLSGKASNNSAEDNKKTIDIELKLEETRQFLNENRLRDESRRTRRASLSLLPSSPGAGDTIPLTGMDAKSRRASTGAAPVDVSAVQPRRSSIKKSGAIPTGHCNEDDDVDGYSTDSEAGNPSRRARARRASLDVKHQMQCEQRSRRGSYSSGVPTFDMEGSYRFDGNNDVHQLAPLQRTSSGGRVERGGGRRASLNDSFSRRGSSSGANRRMSGHTAANPTKPVRKGINPEALARMSRRMSGATGAAMEDDDDDMDHDGGYGYGSGSGDLYGYGFGAPSSAGHRPQNEKRRSHKSHTSIASVTEPHASAGQAPRYERRESHRSDASARSRRRNSFLVRDASSSQVKGGVTPAPGHRVSDSELEPSSGEETKLSGMSSYATNYDSESDMSQSSFRSDRVSNRRNSVIIRPDQDPLAEIEDPDSLLSRSGYYNEVKTPKPLSKEQDDNGDFEPTADALFGCLPDTEKAHSIPISGTANIEPRNRDVPFTTSRSRDRLLSEKLDTTHLSTSTGYSIHNTPWGDTGIDSSSSSDDSESSDESFGVSLYEDSRKQPDYDRYQQRARRRESIENTWIDMTDLIDSGSANKGKQAKAIPGKIIPDFKPATGCSNASDHIVRCFCARLRTGIIVIKHNRSMFSKSQLRVLFLLPDGRTLSWKPMEGEVDKGKRPRLDLSKCSEIRHAWSPDPEAKKLLGTSTLRKRCKDGSTNKSFSLIFDKRTLDVTALSSDQCRVLMEGFSALAFRLQLDRLNDEDLRSSENRKDATGRLDDDWASTVYGGESTISMTQSGVSGAHQPSLPTGTPWGL